MPIDIPGQARNALIHATRQYFRQEREEEIGDLQASLLLDFVLETVGPPIYNTAVRDAQAVMQRAVADLDVTLYEEESGLR